MKVIGEIKVDGKVVKVVNVDSDEKLDLVFEEMYKKYGKIWEFEDKNWKVVMVKLEKLGFDKNRIYDFGVDMVDSMGNSWCLEFNDFEGVIEDFKIWDENS